MAATFRIEKIVKIIEALEREEKKSEEESIRYRQEFTDNSVTLMAYHDGMRSAYRSVIHDLKFAFDIETN